MKPEIKNENKCQKCPLKHLESSDGKCLKCFGPSAHLVGLECKCDYGRQLYHDEECVPCTGPTEFTPYDSPISSYYLNPSGSCACIDGYHLNQAGTVCIKCIGHGAYVENDECKCPVASVGAIDAIVPVASDKSCFCPSGYGWINGKCTNCVENNYDFYNGLTHSCSCGLGGGYSDGKCGISCSQHEMADYNEKTQSWSCTACSGEGAYIVDHYCACLEGSSSNGIGKCSKNCKTSEIIDFHGDQTWNCIACSGHAAIIVNHTCACESLNGNEYTLNGTECIPVAIDLPYKSPKLCPINYNYDPITQKCNEQSSDATFSFLGTLFILFSKRKEFLLRTTFIDIPIGVYFDLHEPCLTC